MIFSALSFCFEINGLAVWLSFVLQILPRKSKYSIILFIEASSRTSLWVTIVYSFVEDVPICLPCNTQPNLVLLAMGWLNVPAHDSNPCLTYACGNPDNILRVSHILRYLYLSDMDIVWTVLPCSKIVMVASYYL